MDVVRNFLARYEKTREEELSLEEVYAAGRDLGLDGYELERFVENAGAWA